MIINTFDGITLICLLCRVYNLSPIVKRKTVFLFLLGLQILTVSAVNQVRQVDSATYASTQEMLMQEYGQHLMCPEEFSLQMLIALSHYPELQNISIVVKFAKIGTTASCRPILPSKGTKVEVDSVLKKYHRKYVIRINVKPDFRGVLLKDVPFNAQVGALAHELGHILDYEKRSSIGLMERAVDYTKSGWKRKFETKIDKITIAHGMGWQLYDWADFVMNKSTATDKYKAFKRKIYMSPEQIAKYIAE
ncbi:MAG: hypothetical protein PHV20_07015 [Bacteroidales bacterium]|nr:hypothetical protein [Bacteroidales bacterium]